MVVSSVDANRAVEDVDAVTANSSAQRQERGGRMPEHTRLAAIVLIEIHVPRPDQ